MNDNSDASLIGSIPRPQNVQKDPDDDTKLWLSEAKRHPVVKAILVVVGAIGFLLLCMGVSMHKSKEPLTSQGQLVENLVLGLGVELSASVLMLVFLIFWLEPKDAHQKVWAILGVASVGLLFCAVPLFFYASFWADLFTSFGVEIFGATIAFAVLDNVVDFISKTQSRIE